MILLQVECYSESRVLNGYLPFSVPFHLFSYELSFCSSLIINYLLCAIFIFPSVFACFCCCRIQLLDCRGRERGEGERRCGDCERQTYRQSQTETEREADRERERCRSAQRLIKSVCFDSKRDPLFNHHSIICRIL